jgi:hypothetical protein
VSENQLDLIEYPVCKLAGEDSREGIYSCQTMIKSLAGEEKG